MNATRTTLGDWLPTASASHPSVAASEKAGAVEASPIVTLLHEADRVLSQALALDVSFRHRADCLHAHTVRLEVRGHRVMQRLS